MNKKSMIWEILSPALQAECQLLCELNYFYISLYYMYFFKVCIHSSSLFYLKY